MKICLYIACDCGLPGRVLTKLSCLRIHCIVSRKALSKFYGKGHNPSDEPIVTADLHSVHSYSGVLLSRFDANLLEDITRLAISAQLIHPVIREQLLQVRASCPFGMCYVVCFSTNSDGRIFCSALEIFCGIGMLESFQR